MDANRFDHLSRSFAERTSRRHAVRGLAGGGLLAALGLSRAKSLAQDTTTCVLDLVAGIRLGPTFDNRPDKDEPFEFQGQLRFAIGEQGRLVGGKFRMSDTLEYDAVGQVAGPAVTIRIAIATDQTLVLVGAGEQALRSCDGAVDGLLTGPQPIASTTFLARSRNEPPGGVHFEVSPAGVPSLQLGCRAPRPLPKKTRQRVHSSSSPGCASVRPTTTVPIRLSRSNSAASCVSRSGGRRTPRRVRSDANGTNYVCM
jgi:hypothetical protein